MAKKTNSSEEKEIQNEGESNKNSSVTNHLDPIPYSNITDFYNTFILNKIIRDIDNINFTNLLNLLPRSSNSTEETAIKHLKEAYISSNLCLVLGAGVSFNFKIPTWDSLLQRLLVKTIEKEAESALLISKLFSKVFNPNPLVAGRYLQTYYSEKDEKNKNKFEKEVRTALYETYDENANSRVVDEIVKLCLAPGNSPIIDSIITYNYDDIIERKLLIKNIDMPFQSVYGQSIDTSKTDLKIFHVHGFLPKEENLGDDNKITLGEFVYHEQYNNIYSWNNIVQINKFRDKICLFIGTSLSDPNIRRLLDIANSQKKQKKYHYIFKKKIDKNWLKKRIELVFSENPEVYDEKVKTKLLLDETIDFLIKYNNRYEEKDSESLGVKTVWINDYDEDISNILKKLRQ